MEVVITMLGEEKNEIDSKIVYLYRHGETNWNVDDRVTGQLENIEIYFTERGYQQIEDLSEKLRENQVEVIYASDLSRTTETAVLVNEKLNLPVFYSKEIRGLNMGKYQGLLREDFATKDDVRACFANHDLVIPGGESVNALNERVINFIKKICSESEYKKIAIISHSGAISNLRAYLMNDNYVRINKCVLLYNNNNLSVLDYESNNSNVNISK